MRSIVSCIICILALILNQIPGRHANEHKLGALLFKSPVGIRHLCRFYSKLPIGIKALK